MRSLVAEPPVTWMRLSSVFQVAWAALRVWSKFQPGFSAARLARAFATLTNETPTFSRIVWLVDGANRRYTPLPLPEAERAPGCAPPCHAPKLAAGALTCASK